MFKLQLERFTQLGKKIVGAGINYKSLASARGVMIPKEPIIFLKPTSSYITEGHPIKCYNCYYNVHFHQSPGLEGHVGLLHYFPVWFCPELFHCRRLRIYEAKLEEQPINNVAKISFFPKWSVAQSLGVPEPCKPVIFLKPSTSYITEGHPIQIPKYFEVNHEVELGVIIGHTCKNVSPDNVIDYIGGYCLALDLTAVNVLAEARATGKPWAIGKGFDTACPVSGPICKEHIPCHDNVPLWLAVNNEKRQDINTCDMIFPTDELISYISNYMTLEPYDLILTGTGLGSGKLCIGDTVTAGLSDLATVCFEVKCSV